MRHDDVAPMSMRRHFGTKMPTGSEVKTITRNIMLKSTSIASEQGRYRPKRKEIVLDFRQSNVLQM